MELRNDIEPNLGDPHAGDLFYRRHDVYEMLS